MGILQSEITVFEDRPEWALISRILAGERKIFHELVRPHEIAVYLTAFSVLRNSEEAERAAQNAILQAFANLRSFKPGEPYRIWLLQFVLREAHHEREKRRPTPML